MNSVPSSELGRAGQIVAGKFRLDVMIGRGGMGSVWAATHMGLGHRVAIKLIAREFVRSSEALRRFDAEAKAAARLQSRHVVQVFDNGMLDDGTPFIAMELLSGENVSDRIAHRGPFSLAQAVDVLAQCCKALGRAHAAGIVHRDIKPDNIFLAQEPDTDGDVVKILDFGVAKMTIGIDGASQVTGTGALLGTPLFMSPEQIRGSRDCDHRSDLYSLGLVAYTMLTGQLAVAGDSFGDILVKICTEPLPSLVGSAPALPYPMEAWFQRACAREPAGRCQSAQEFIETLRVAAGASMAPARETTTPPLPTLQSAATRGSPSADAPAFAQSAAAVSVTAAGVPKRPVGPWIAAGILAVLFAVGGAVLLAVAPSHRDATADSASAASAAGIAPAGSSTALLAPAATVSLAAAPADAGGPARARSAEGVSAAAPMGPAATAPTAPVAAAPTAPAPTVTAAVPPTVAAVPFRPIVPATPAMPVTAAAPPAATTTPTVFRPVPLPRPAATINVGY
jgi:hypothetical protein